MGCVDLVEGEGEAFFGDVGPGTDGVEGEVERDIVHGDVVG